MAQNQPKITIAMPVYNGADYLSQAIESALAQTYPHTEVLVVNDGSTDGGATDSIAQKYQDKIRYFSQENRGVGGAMNTVLCHMKGDYFSWLSHDDLWLPKKLESQLKFLEKLGKKDAIIFSNYFIIDEKGNILREVELPFDEFIDKPMLPLLAGQINGCTLMIPSAIMKKFGSFDEDLRFVQDYDFWNKILTQYEFFLQPETLVKYRHHSGQGTRKPEMAAEGDLLWIDMVTWRTRTERVQLCGSAKKFYVGMAKRLGRTPYKQAALYAEERGDEVSATTLVSVILLCSGDGESVARAARTVLDQTYRNIEVIVVGEAVPSVVNALEPLWETDHRVRWVQQEVCDVAEAVDAGIEAARGEYIAILQVGCEFLPEKIERQLGIMQNEGVLVSHTSFGVERSGGEMTLVKSGDVGGLLYSGVVSTLPQICSTWLFHRSILETVALPHEDSGGIFDMAFWVRVGFDHGVFGIPHALTVLRSNFGDLDDKIIRVHHLRDLAIEANTIAASRSSADKSSNFVQEAESISRQLMREGAVLEAISILKAVTKDPKKILSRISVAYAEAGYLKDAIASFKRYLDVFPQEDRHWYYLASCLASDGKFGEADAIFRRNQIMHLTNGMKTSTSIIKLVD